MIYEPAEDSYLLERVVKKCSNGKTVLEVGTGSGILARAALHAGATHIVAVDVDAHVVKALRDDEFEVRQSDLFLHVREKFDLIVFNPPYLPEDEREDAQSALITSGGKKGDEIVLRFLRDAKKHLNAGGVILLLLSSLTPRERIERVLREQKLKAKVVAREKLFMEKLEVWKIRKN